ncbi:MAG: hypothetical protein M0014_12205, partial [Actinomycetota bacterium]|nr:hypothetical protein [Actinomycetota bacterium]
VESGLPAAVHVVSTPTSTSCPFTTCGETDWVLVAQDSVPFAAPPNEENTTSVGGACTVTVTGAGDGAGDGDESGVGLGAGTDRQREGLRGVR